MRCPAIVTPHTLRARGPILTDLAKSNSPATAHVAYSSIPSRPTTASPGNTRVHSARDRASMATIFSSRLTSCHAPSAPVSAQGRRSNAARAGEPASDADAARVDAPRREANDADAVDVETADAADAGLSASRATRAS